MKDYLYMVLAAICMGAIGVLVKLIGTDVHFMTLNFYRVFFGFCFLLAVVPFIDKKTFKITRKDAEEYLFIGIIYAIALSLYTTANLYAPVQNVVLLNYSYPFFVLIFAYVILKERVTTAKVITLIIACVGLIIINPFKFGVNNVGNILALLGAVFMAVLVTEMRKEDKNHGIGDVVWFLFFASLALLPFPFMFGFGGLTLITFTYVLLLGVVSTGLAYLLYNLALEKIEAEIASIIATIITPLISILLAVVIISEPLNLRIIVGGLFLVMSGVYLELHNKQIKDK